MMKALNKSVILSLLLTIFTFEITYGKEEQSALPSIFHDLTNVPTEIQLESWEEVKHKIPRYSKFKVIDLETGLVFNVQRRAGSKHADVQPLTHKDTKIMKQIYDGHWSWKRRAIIVKTKEGAIAGSMHGMPHGAGAIRNGFPGHFCIHFPGSTTHKSKNEDISHQLMILKSAGLLNSYMKTTSAEDVLDVFIVAINNEDHALLTKATKKNKSPKHLFSQVVKIEKMDDEDEMMTSGLAAIFPVKVAYKVDGRIHQDTMNILVKRKTFLEQWVVDIEQFEEQLGLGYESS